MRLRDLLVACGAVAEPEGPILQRWDGRLDPESAGAALASGACVTVRVSSRRDYDLVIRGGTVFDGLGGPGRVMDVGITGGRIAALGPSLSAGRDEISAPGLAVTPGFIETDMTHVLTDEQKTNMLAHIPLKRFGKPEEIAGVIDFLRADNDHLRAVELPFELRRLETEELVEGNIHQLRYARGRADADNRTTDGVVSRRYRR